MADKNPETDYVAVAVAPVSYGFMQLGDALASACAEAGLQAFGQPRLLGNEEKWAAVELSVKLNQIDLFSARYRMRTALEPKIDMALIAKDSRRKKLLISDMDSTIIQQECLDELADYAGLKTEIAAITARAMAGELNFEGALTERVGRLKGLKLQALADCYRERITLMPGARTLTATMATHGAHCLLVSGGFTYFTSRIADLAGFHAHQGNRLLDDGTSLTGEVGQPILGREAKLTAMDQALETHNLTREDAIAMGDGANDLAMIQAAGLGLAVHAKPVVADASDAAINHTDLTSALYFQGYSDSEIIWSD